MHHRRPSFPAAVYRGRRIDRLLRRLLSEHRLTATPLCGGDDDLQLVEVTLDDDEAAGHGAEGGDGGGAAGAAPPDDAGAGTGTPACDHGAVDAPQRAAPTPHAASTTTQRRRRRGVRIGERKPSIATPWPGLFGTGLRRTFVRALCDPTARDVAEGAMRWRAAVLLAAAAALLHAVVQQQQAPPPTLADGAAG
eukprot:gene17743-51134_t